MINVSDKEWCRDKPNMRNFITDAKWSNSTELLCIEVFSKIGALELIAFSLKIYSN